MSALDGLAATLGPCESCGLFAATRLVCLPPADGMWLQLADDADWFQVCGGCADVADAVRPDDGGASSTW